MAPSLLCAFALWGVGCLAPHERADRAFKSGSYGEALDLYEDSISEGTQDPEVYYRAGMAAMRVGEFSAAERHLSRALRYGGGVPAAQQLATLYIQTSNYARAVSVLRFLLDTDAAKQPVYNNLGTALMYAGEVLDAESYLLIAQQMNPKDPVPYVNLGVLYDRYIKRASLSREFYGCYLELAPRGGQAGTVSTRLRQMNDGETDIEFLEVTCGEVYRPSNDAPRAGKLKEAMGSVDLGFEEDPSASQEKIVVNEGAAKGEAKLAPPEPQAEPKVDVRAQATAAYARGEDEEVVGLLGALPASEVGAEDALLMARSYERMKKPDLAERWYKTAVVRGSTPEHVGAMLEFLWSERRLGELGVQCRQWTGDEYAEVRGRCDELEALIKGASGK
jgi:tetratricopeptide (TPR) repeat protein